VEITLLTRDLTIYPQREYAETGAAVTITSGRNEMQAVGMRLDLSDGRLELLSETKGKYVTKPR
jgi:lipopolysaccharide export system protein LptC